MATGKRVNAANVPRRKAQAAPVPVRRPKLGQNFLVDRSIAGRIVDALGDVSQATVVEIGPGRGILTDVLAKRARHLIAIELDRVLAAQLRMKYSGAPNVEIIEADVLAVDFSTVLGPRPLSLTGVAGTAPLRARVVGNIPYYITSDILLRLFEFHEHVESMVIMVQLEVAERIAAKPGSRDYGLLSASAQLYARVEKLFTVPAGAFNPPPKVQSAVLRLSMAPQFQRLGVDPDGFVRFLKLSFGQKRKTLVNNLKAEYDGKLVRGALEKARLRADVRAEAVPLDKAAVLYGELNAVSNGIAAAAPPTRK
jgi:16S rRNA (adenine1518-N6/adenine1519-N6)-dimethyltransferase